MVHSLPFSFFFFFPSFPSEFHYLPFFLNFGFEIGIDEIFILLLELCFFFLLIIQVETRTLEEVNEVLQYASQMKTSLTRIMLDNMVVPLPNGDVDVSMLKEAVQLINGRFETEVLLSLVKAFIFLLTFWCI